MLPMKFEVVQLLTVLSVQCGLAEPVVFETVEFVVAVAVVTVVTRVELEKRRLVDLATRSVWL